MLKNPTAFNFPVAPANFPVPLFTTAKPVMLIVVGAAPSSAQTFAEVSNVTLMLLPPPLITPTPSRPAH